MSDTSRFQFGANWQRFLASVDDERIRVAAESLQQRLGVRDLVGKRFLDIGSGSGLFSLAARRLGAKVHSFDYDPQSVACTAELRRRYFPDDPAWVVERGDILDRGYIDSLGRFDVVYSWGVLHHTGAMWTALENATRAVADNGSLFIAIYNDQGATSKMWTAIKRMYNRSARPLQFLLVLGVGTIFTLRRAAGKLLRLQNPLPFKEWAARKQIRGMSVWHDLVDWVGGYPFEVAKPEKVFAFCRERSFILTNLATEGGGHGCNEYVFLRRS